MVKAHTGCNGQRRFQISDFRFQTFPIGEAAGVLIFTILSYFLEWELNESLVGDKRVGAVIKTP